MKTAMKKLLLTLLFTLCVTTSWAKPIGAFYSGASAPSWISFSTIADTATDAQIADAVVQCQTRGMRWIVQLGYSESLITPIGPHAAAVKARMTQLGLDSCIVAQMVWEEWYELWGLNWYAQYNFPNTVPESVAIDIIHYWAGVQNKQAKDATGWPTIWLTTAVLENRPVPDNVDIVALDAYTACGQTFAESVVPRVVEAERLSALPKVIVPQWFRSTGPRQDPMWACGPPADSFVGYKQILDRPQWIAMLGFVLTSIPEHDIMGIMDMPNEWRLLKQSLGVE